MVGVVTFCRNSATPVAAEEGLTGVLSSGADAGIKGYGDVSGFTDDEVSVCSYSDYSPTLIIVPL